MNTKYVVSAEFKVAGLTTKRGKWPDGIRLEICPSTEKPYSWVGITGTGNSEGWVKAIIPTLTQKRIHN